ncbi:MAG: hypothetical protein NC928_02130 [Candidatus Omnitrophica bacterium]|nr:hypothetical protein [Candidatus Omnitrophota bacterium]
MKFYPPDAQISKLLTKGGVMFFTIERPDFLYRGAVVLSSVNARGKHTRIVLGKVYRCK